MKKLRSSVLLKFAGVVLYVPFVFPGVLDTPMFCVGEGGRVAVESSRETHCPLPVAPLLHGCCSSEAGSSTYVEGACHCGPCIDIPVPVDQTVTEDRDVSPEPVGQFLAHGSAAQMASSPGFAEVLTRPPPGRPLLARSIRTVVLRI